MKLALVGGEEFADGFEKVHAALLSPIKEGKSRGVYLPTCAAHDGHEVVQSWCERSIQRLSPYVARVDAPAVVDKASASDPDHIRLIDAADWVYFGGGFPNIGMGILEDTPMMIAIQNAAARGSLMIGASAGAMMMCERSIAITPALMEGGAPTFFNALNWVPNAICFPHFDRSYARRWLDQQYLFRPLSILGIDEQTALANANGAWQVIGRGGVTVVAANGELTRYTESQAVMLP